MIEQAILIIILAASTVLVVASIILNAWQGREKRKVRDTYAVIAAHEIKRLNEKVTTQEAQGFDASADRKIVQRVLDELEGQ